MNFTRASSCRHVLAISAVALPLVAAGTMLGASGANGATAELSRVPRSTTSPTALVAAVKKAMSAARSVHFEFNSTSSSGHEHVVADAGAKTGRQSITFGKATANILVTTSDAYFDGNSSGLSTIFGMPKSDITKVGSKWVDVKSGTSQYTSLRSGAIESSLSTTLLPSSAELTTAKVSKTSSAGIPVYRLVWTTTATSGKVTEMLLIDARGSDLPITATAVEGKDNSLTSFSKWGESIKLSAPTSLIAFSKLTS